MIDFISNCFERAYKNDEDDGFDEQKVMIDSMKKVLPLILKNELTERQSLCMRLFYVHGKSQREIARQLGVSQPTVCRHIVTGKAVTNKILKYCTIAVTNANDCWINAEFI